MSRVIPRALGDSLALRADQKPRLQLDAKQKAAALSFSLNTQKILSLVEGKLKSQYGDDYDASEAKVLMDGLGFRSLEGISVMYRPEGPYVANDPQVRAVYLGQGFSLPGSPPDRSPTRDSSRGQESV